MKKVILLILFVSSVIFLVVYTSQSGVYISGAHGNNTYGVLRTSTSGFARGNCMHCHEQHASLDAEEPQPQNFAPSKYALFYDNFISQTDNFCLQCHTAMGSYQSGGLINRSYSYRSGGYTPDTIQSVYDQFNTTTPPPSSHWLSDILNFINGKWFYTLDSNPCTACHNPHAAQGDPANAPNSPKTSGSRGYPVSRPSQHSKDSAQWGLWGDGQGEKMSDYTTGYWAPYRYNSTTAYEPDGSTTQDGSNLTDFVSLCTDCHNATNIINSTPLGRNLLTINWSLEKHGNGLFTIQRSVRAPYNSGTAPTNINQSCLDCHEPHGSSNAGLIRVEVNGAVLAGQVTTINSTDTTPPYIDTNKTGSYLCQRCHMDDYTFNASCPQNGWYYVHHDAASGDPPYSSPGTCTNCHNTATGSGCNATVSPINCFTCHYHNSLSGTERTF